MKHNICTGGCKGVSETAGVCETVDCSKNGQPLTECECGDQMHNGAFDEEVKASTSEEVPSA